jgi:hypothetical protein
VFMMFKKYFAMRISCVLIVMLLISTLSSCVKKKTTDNTAAKTGQKPATSQKAAGSTATKTVSKTTIKSNTGSDNESQNNNEGTESDDDSNNSDDGDNAEFEEDLIDLGGKTIIVASPNINWFPPNDVEKTIEGTYGRAKWYNWKYVEEKYNCKISLNYINGYPAFTTALLSNFSAGTYFCDAFIVDNSFAIPTYYNYNMLANWGELYNFREDPYWNEPLYLDMPWGTWKEKIVGLELNAGPAPGVGVWYNRDLLNREGIPDLFEYVDANNWNWETFAEVCQMITRDLNGDGFVDQWGLASPPATIANALIASNGGNIVEVINNKATYTLDDPRNIRALGFMSDLYNVYKVVPQEADLSSKSSFKEFFLGTIGMFLFGPAYGAGGPKNGMPGSAIGYTWVPKGPDASDYRLFASNSMGMFLNAQGIDNKTSAVVLQDFQCVWKESKPTSCYYEVLSYDNLWAGSIPWAFDDRSIDFLVVQRFKSLNMYDSNFGLGSILTNELYNQVIKQSFSVTAGMDAVRSKLIETIANLDVVK